MAAAGPGVLGGGVQGGAGEVEADGAFGGEAFGLDAGEEPQRLGVSFEAAAVVGELVQCLFAVVAEGRVAEVVGEAGGLDEVRVAAQGRAEFPADLGAEPEVKRLVESVLARFGRIDVLVNCAAVWKSKRLEDVTAADVRMHFDTNALSTFLTGQHVGLQHAELQAHAARAIHALTPKLRDSLLLAQSGEYHYDEIARMLGVPVGTVKWRISEARRRVREKLSALGYVDAK